jgi:hypothetical protein
MELLNTHPIKKSDLGFHGNLFGEKLLFGGKLLFISMDYRKLWESVNGKIPKDKYGRSYEIHHIDGNRKNNSIDNLMCVSIDEHYYIHLKNYEETGNFKDLAACRFLSSKLKKEVKEISGYTVSEETRKKISKTLTGVKHPKERVEKMIGKIKGIKWSKENIEARRQGMLEYYKNASEEELQERWKKISEAHKNKKLTNETKEKLSRINSKLSDEEVLEIKKLIINKINYNVISEKYNISPAQITAIKQEKTYKWLWKNNN